MSAAPYEKESEIREAMRLTLMSATGPGKRADYLARLAATGEPAARLVSLLLDNMRTRPLDTQRDVIALVEHFAEQRIDYAGAAELLASHLNTPDDDLRHRITALIVNLGSRAKPAEDFALGCLRNQNRDIVMSGLLILDAIGRHCTKAIRSRLKLAYSPWQGDEEVRPLFKRILNHLSTAEQETAHPSSSATLRVSIRRDSFAGLRALIVEENDAFRESVALALRAGGMDVVEAVNAEMALEVLRATGTDGQHIDLFILTVMLSGMNGIQLLKELRTQEAFRETPTLVLSAVDKKEIIMAMRSLGVREYLLKPVRIERVVASVRDLLEIPS